MLPAILSFLDFFFFFIFFYFFYKYRVDSHEELGRWRSEIEDSYEGQEHIAVCVIVHLGCPQKKKLQLIYGQEKTIFHLLPSLSKIFTKIMVARCYLVEKILLFP